MKPLDDVTSQLCRTILFKRHTSYMYDSVRCDHLDRACRGVRHIKRMWISGEKPLISTANFVINWNNRPQITLISTGQRLRRSTTSSSALIINQKRSGYSFDFSHNRSSSEASEKTEAKALIPQYLTSLQVVHIE